nr:RNA polymerase subunit beta [Coccidia sp. AB-2023a]
MSFKSINHIFVKNIETIYNKYEILLKIYLLKYFKTLLPNIIYNKEKTLQFKFLPEFIKFKFNKLSSEYNTLSKELNSKLQVLIPLKITHKTLNKTWSTYYNILELPKIDFNGNFILNGMKRVIVSKLVRNNGIYFKSYNKYNENVYRANIILNSFRNFSIELSSDGIFLYTNINKKLNLIKLIHFLGLSNKEIISYSRYGNSFYIKELLLKANKDYYFTSKDLVELEKVKNILYLISTNLHLKYFKNKYNTFNHINNLKVQLINRFGNFSNKTESILALDLISIFDFLLDLKFNKRTLNDLDHFGNKNLESLGNIISSHLETSLPFKLTKILNFLFKYKFKNILLKDLKDFLIKNKLLIKELLIVNPLIQYLEEINSVSQLMHKVKISCINPESISPSRASIDIRDVRPSQLGKLCILDTNEGSSSGLVEALAKDARITNKGIIETPIISNKNRTSYLKYLNIFEQENFVVSFENIIKQKKNIFNNYTTIITFEKGEIKNNSNISNSFYKLNPSNLLSYTENLIPFLFYNDPTRCLMGARMQTQSVPLIYRQKPYILTGFESIVASKSCNILRAYQEGIVTKVTSYKIVIRDLFNREITYYLQKYKKTNQGTLIYQTPLVWPGEKVTSGQLLIETQDISDYEFNIGNNLNILYGSHYGYEYEDALIISNKLLYKNIFTSLHFDIYETKYYNIPLEGPEFSSLNIPKRSLYQKRHLNSLGIIKEGVKVLDGDILISKVVVTNVTLKHSTMSEIIVSLFGSKLRQTQDKSIIVPIGKSGRVVKIELFSVKNKLYKKQFQSYLKLRVFVIKQRMLQIGDKLCGRHGNKGVISNIAEEIDLPYTNFYQSPDIITGPLGVPSRMNLGQLFESLFGYVCSIKNKRLIINSLLNKKLNSNYTKNYLYNYLYLLKDYTGNFKQFNPYIPGKVLLRDGRSGYRLKGSSFIGNIQYSKLIHMVKDKVHYRTIGSYNEITQQPIKGRGKGGGQRFGEMEVWALEAFGASYNLKELLNSKSDDLSSRKTLQEYILTGKDSEASSLSESFKLIIRELHGLNLNLESFMVTDMLDGKLLPLNINY